MWKFVVEFSFGSKLQIQGIRNNRFYRLVVSVDLKTNISSAAIVKQNNQTEDVVLNPPNNNSMQPAQSMRGEMSTRWIRWLVKFSTFKA